MTSVEAPLLGPDAARRRRADRPVASGARPSLSFSAGSPSRRSTRSSSLCSQPSRRTRTSWATHQALRPTGRSRTSATSGARRTSVPTSFHSLIVVTASVLLIGAVSCLAGYAFAHMRFPLRRVGLLAMIGLMLVPGAVLMVPLFRVIFQLGLLNQYQGLILLYTAVSLPFNIYLMTSYFEKVPPQLLQAARIDGASELATFRTVALPLARAGLLTLFTLNFLGLWNELLFSLLILNDESKRTLMTGLALLDGQYTTATPTLAAGLLITLDPTAARLRVLPAEPRRGHYRRRGQVGGRRVIVTSMRSRIGCS